MKIRQMMAFFVGVTAAVLGAGELSATEQAMLMAGSPGVHAASPIALLVMAVGRSGSSMVGEFFKQNEVRYEAYNIETVVLAHGLGKLLEGVFFRNSRLHDV